MIFCAQVARTVPLKKKFTFINFCGNESIDLRFFYRGSGVLRNLVVRNIADDDVHIYS